MKNQQFISIVMLLLCTSMIGTIAQEAILTSGCSSSGSGGSVCFSVGQMVYATSSNAYYSVAQGVQQPFEISISVGINDILEANHFMSAYPNPANDFIKLNVKDYKVDNLRFQLYDLTGKLLKEEKITGNETLIDLSSMQQAIYFLKVTDNNKDVKIFKIIKK